MMHDDQWKLVCTGSICDGFDSQTVIENLSSLNINATMAAQLMAGRAVTLKKDLDKARAEAMCSRLQQAGLEVIIEPMAPPPAKLSLDALSLEPMDGEESPPLGMAATATPPATELQPGEMECPKCYSIQRKAPECASCGIIISRYVERQKRLKEQEHATQFAQRDDDDEYVADESLLQTIWGHTLGKLAVVAVVFVVVFNLFLLKRPGYQELGATPEAQAQIAAVLKATELEASIPSEKELKQYLAAQQYHELESILRDLDRKTRQDIVWENAYLSAVWKFHPDNGFDVRQLDQWVSETRSAWSYLARGTYYNGAAWNARGNAYASKTSQHQMQEFHRLQGLAYQDLITARDKDRDLLPIYSALMSVSTTQKQVSEKEVLEQAIEANPAGYYYRYAYLQNLLPKWGGSYGEMAKFAEDTSPYYALNPRLWLLQGFVAAEKAHPNAHNDSNNACIQLYNEALQFGAHSDWLSHRAFCLSNKGDQESALKDITLSMKLGTSKFARNAERLIKSRL